MKFLVVENLSEARKGGPSRTSKAQHSPLTKRVRAYWKRAAPVIRHWQAGVTYRDSKGSRAAQTLGRMYNRQSGQQGWGTLPISGGKTASLHGQNMDLAANARRRIAAQNKDKSGGAHPVSRNHWKSIHGYALKQARQNRKSS